VFLVQVILIHLSNITGLADDYSKRTMILLVSDIGTIVWGVTAAIASGYVKVWAASCTDMCMHLPHVDTRVCTPCCRRRYQQASLDNC
jgi:hypothetical protein